MVIIQRWTHGIWSTCLWLNFQDILKFTVKPYRPPASRDHLSMETTWLCPNSAWCTIDIDLCKETTSLVRPLFLGPQVVTIDKFNTVYKHYHTYVWYKLIRRMTTHNSIESTILIVNEATLGPKHSCLHESKDYINHRENSSKKCLWNIIYIPAISCSKSLSQVAGWSTVAFIAQANTTGKVAIRTASWAIYSLQCTCIYTCIQGEIQKCSLSIHRVRKCMHSVLCILVHVSISTDFYI